MLGWTFMAASRWSAAFRSQLSRDLVIEIRSDHSVAHQFVFRGRRATAIPGRTEPADCALRFATASQGFAVLTAPDGPHRTLAGLLDGTITIEGRTALMPWFQGLLPAAIPGLPVLRLPAVERQPNGAAGAVEGEIDAHPSVQWDASWSPRPPPRPERYVRPLHHAWADLLRRVPSRSTCSIAPSAGAGCACWPRSRSAR